MPPSVKPSDKIIYYASFTPDRELIRAASEGGVFDRNFGLLASFAYFNSPSGRSILKMCRARVCADSGSFTAKSNPYTFIKYKMNDLADFYHTRIFQFVTEPDVISKNPHLSIGLAARRALKLKMYLNESVLCSLARTLQGDGFEGKKTHYTEMLERTGFSPSRYALGGLTGGDESPDEVKRSLNFLNDEKIESVHIFGRTSADFLRLVAKVSSEMNFKEISIDSTTWYRSAAESQMVHWFDGNKMLKFHFSRKRALATNDELEILRNCKCPFCAYAVLGDENGIARNLADLGIANFYDTPRYLSKLFKRKAQLHNLWMEKVQFNYFRATADLN